MSLQTVVKNFLLIFAVAFVASGCATTGGGGDPTMTADIIADPGGATVLYKGKDLGLAPVTLSVESIEDVLEIDAELAGQELVEKRIRVTATDKVEVVFRFGGQQSAIADALGLTKVVIFEYSERATFEVDQWRLNPRFFPMLTQQAEMLNTAFSGLDVFICGFTDSTGTVDHNLELSLKRAEAVSDYLTEHGVERQRLKPQGFGEDYPVASNGTADGRSLNRRTEIVLPQ
jgi:outer membrane protein OmpA-like peptidoglycan-associated protein